MPPPYHDFLRAEKKALVPARRIVRASRRRSALQGREWKLVRPSTLQPLSVLESGNDLRPEPPNDQDTGPGSVLEDLQATVLQEGGEPSLRLSPYSRVTDA